MRFQRFAVFYYLVVTFTYSPIFCNSEWSRTWRLNDDERIIQIDQSTLVLDVNEIESKMRQTVEAAGDQHLGMCAGNRTVQVPQVEFPKDTKYYPFLQSSLQLFLNFSMPCDGSITSFRFLSATPEIFGFHIGIFRHTCAGIFQLTSDTYLHNYDTKMPPYSWVEYKDWKKIEVKKGDIIGVFYDNKDVQFNSVVLPTASLRNFESNKEFKTLVYLKDAYELTKIDGCLQFEEGVQLPRVPALQAVLKPETNMSWTIQAPIQGPYMLVPIGHGVSTNSGDKVEVRETLKLEPTYERASKEAPMETLNLQPIFFDNISKESPLETLRLQPRRNQYSWK